ncbi:hypothetical protein NCGM1900_5951 [Pseudomonas aeruginosa]|nr:hypothetical protein NCGM1900_5951 [Pseudomonas aeruginosa]BAP53821.1 hypothetical protein NCGM1984_5890 [Pseudomonas aeruginosa]
MKTTISTGKMAILPTPDLVGASDPAFYSKCHHWVERKQDKTKSPARGGAFRDSWCRHQESNPGATDYKAVSMTFLLVSRCFCFFR